MRSHQGHYYMGKLLSGGVATDKEGTLIDRTNLPRRRNTIFRSFKSTRAHEALYNLGSFDGKKLQERRSIY